jgi:protocatechuate 4,5-dioxygenase alpha chain
MNEPEEKSVGDIHDYLAALEDIPGTRVFTAKRARQGYHLNQFAMSLMTAENRERFKRDEHAYLDEWPLSEEQKDAVSTSAGTSISSPSCSRPTDSASRRRSRP